MDPDNKGRRGARTIQRILSAAVRRFGQVGYQNSSMGDVARDAGISTGELQRHFHTKERLLIETQRATFRQLYQRFVERARLGNRGMPSALDALDAMWGSVRELRVGIPFLIETFALASQEDVLGAHLREFYTESTQLLEDGIRTVFSEDVEALTIQPERMAILIRLLLSGLMLELSQARSTEDLSDVDNAYADLRMLFERFVLVNAKECSVDIDSLEALPLPW